VFCLLLALLAFTNWITTRQLWWYGLALVALAMSLLLKPFVVFFFPVFVAIAFAKYRQQTLKLWLLYPFLLGSLIPFIWWRNWINQFPSGIPANKWLFNSNVEVQSGNYL